MMKLIPSGSSKDMNLMIILLEGNTSSSKSIKRVLTGEQVVSLAKTKEYGDSCAI